ncbi:MAG: hypothetical protein H6942_15325 [Candidatus Accumulibacter sp.]|uniref:hypothetical protein n=1 Tax=Accumulibacter sp. TaxID=2053492 RepID=UPI001DB8EEDE|nr:hypothetical protein [Accumulibacter sp.]MCB1942279.1 hypothetical protein [Accumulibacter sp.]MCP5249883.1 hypothetical protein [Accumulibacter sp.]
MTTSKNIGLVLFSVSHDKNKGFFLSRGANLQFSVDFRSVDSNIEIPAAFSNDPLVPVVTSAFDDDWGRVYARDFAAGRFELTGWSLKEYRGQTTVFLRVVAIGMAALAALQLVLSTLCRRSDISAHRRLCSGSGHSD